MVGQLVCCGLPCVCGVRRRFVCMMIINVYDSHWLSGTSAVVVGCQAVRSRVLLGSWVFKFLCPGPCPCGGSGCLPFFLKAVPSPFLRPGWRGSRQRVTPWGGQEPTDELPYSTRPGFHLNESWASGFTKRSLIISIGRAPPSWHKTTPIDIAGGADAGSESSGWGEKGAGPERAVGGVTWKQLWHRSLEWAWICQLSRRPSHHRFSPPQIRYASGDCFAWHGAVHFKIHPDAYRHVSSKASIV